MKTIWKFPLKPQGLFSISVPPGSKVLMIGSQRNKPMMWVEFDLTVGIEKYVLKKIHVILTGDIFEKISESQEKNYLGSFILYDGDFVGHVYEVLG